MGSDGKTQSGVPVEGKPLDVGALGYLVVSTDPRPDPASQVSASPHSTPFDVDHNASLYDERSA